MKCDCGSETFFSFGPYPLPGDYDTGLRHIYTCTKCGDQLRVYQATKMPEAIKFVERALDKKISDHGHHI